MLPSANISAQTAGHLVPVVDLLLSSESEPVDPPPPPPPPPPPDALDTKVLLTAGPGIAPDSTELVTFGLPIAENVISNLDDIRVSIGGTESRICIEQTMTWWGSDSIRAIKVQLRNVDMTGGDVEVSISDAGRNTTRDLSCLPTTDGWESAGPVKSNELAPRIFAIHDLDYLAESDLVPPYQPAPAVQDNFESYVVRQVNQWSGGLDFDDSRSANWLFDRSTAYFKSYMSTGRVELLKEAALSKQYYFQFVRNDASNPHPSGSSGCWNRTGVACADGKYIAPQQAKLALALLGDDTQWDSALIVKMAQQADLGWNQYHCSRSAPTDQNFGFTERACGLIGLALLTGYEMTGDSGLLSTMNEIIAYLKSIQQTVFDWDSNNSWTPKSGAFTHDIDVHEGNHSVNSAPEDYTDGQGFSPWMSENTADFLWQAYWLTGHTDIPEMLRRLGNAIDLYGFTSAYHSPSQTHVVKSEFGSSHRTLSCNTEKDATELLYFGSAYAGDSQRTDGDWWRYFTDSHNIEVVLPLAAAYYFESSSASKTRLRARIDKIMNGMINTNCANGGSTKRLFNWQHRSNSIRTWQWVDGQ